MPFPCIERSTPRSSHGHAERWVNHSVRKPCHYPKSETRKWQRGESHSGCLNSGPHASFPVTDREVVLADGTSREMALGKLDEGYVVKADTIHIYKKKNDQKV